MWMVIINLFMLIQKQEKKKKKKATLSPKSMETKKGINLSHVKKRVNQTTEAQ